jgi:hypothetical protein
VIKVIFSAEEIDAKGFLSGLIVALLLLFFISGCQARPSVFKPALEMKARFTFTSRPSLRRRITSDLRFKKLRPSKRMA